MDNTGKKLLKDILTCIESIESYLGNSKKFEEYDTDFLIQECCWTQFDYYRGSHESPFSIAAGSFYYKLKKSGGRS